MKETVVRQPGSTGSGSTGSAIRPIKLVEATDWTEPLVISVYGSPGVGKSRLAGSSLGDIGLIPTEHKSKQVITEAAKFGRKVIIPDQDLIRVANPMLIQSLPNTCIVIGDAKHTNWTPGQLQDEMQEIADRIDIYGAPPKCCRRHFYRWSLSRMKTVAYEMALDKPNIKTLVIDTMGQMIDDTSMANYGLTGVIDPKEFGFAPRQDMNQEVRDFLNTISCKHLVLSFHSSEIWKDGKPTKLTKPMSNFSKIGHYTSVMLELRRNPDTSLEREWTYVCGVKDCMANAEIIGLDILYDEDISFSKIAQLVYPDTDPDLWG